MTQSLVRNGLNSAFEIVSNGKLYETDMLQVSVISI